MKTAGFPLKTISSYQCFVTKIEYIICALDTCQINLP